MQQVHPRVPFRHKIYYSILPQGALCAMARSPQLSDMGDMIQLVNYEKWKKKWTVSGDACVNQSKDIVIRLDRIDELIQTSKNEMQNCISCPCTLEPITDPCIDDFGNSYQHSELKTWF